jgi:hypothetical protein
MAAVDLTAESVLSATATVAAPDTSVGVDSRSTDINVPARAPVSDCAGAGVGAGRVDSNTVPVDDGVDVDAGTTIEVDCGGSADSAADCGIVPLERPADAGPNDCRLVAAVGTALEVAGD